MSLVQEAHQTVPSGFGGSGIVVLQHQGCSWTDGGHLPRHTDVLGRRGIGLYLNMVMWCIVHNGAILVT